MIIPSQPLNGNNPRLKKYTWNEYKKVYQICNISDSMIIYEQSKALEYYEAINKKYSGLIQQLNSELTDEVNNSEFELAIQESLNNISGNLQGLKKNVFDGEKAKGEKFQAELNNLINQYKKLIKNVESFSNIDTVAKAIQQLKINTAILEDNVSSISSYSQLSSIRLSKSNNMISTQKKNTKSLIRSLSGIGNALKGFQLEVEATNKIKKHIPISESNNTKVLQTGSFRYIIDLNRRSVDIKEDIALFDLASNIKIQLGDGSYITIKELVERSKTETITMTSAGYSALQEAMITAVSAKASTRKDIVLHSGLTVKKILQSRISQDEYYWGLYHQSQLSDLNNSYRGNNSYNSALINYNLGRDLISIIGLKNNLIVTQRGFETTYDFLRNILLVNKDYIRVQRASLRHGMNVIAPNK